MQVLHHEAQRPEDAGILAQRARLDFALVLQPGERVPVDGAADRGQQDAVVCRHLAPDDNQLRVEQVDERGKPLADFLSGTLQQVDGEDVVLRCRLPEATVSRHPVFPQ